MSYLLDIILIAVIIISAVLAYKKGFVPTLCDLGGKIVALIGARLLSLSLAPMVYENYLQSGIENTLTTKLGSLSSVDVGAQVESALNSIPQSMDGIIGMLGIDRAALVQKVDSMELTGENLIDTLMTSIVSPVVTAVCKVILFAVLFFVLALVLRIVLGFLAKIIKKIPGLKQLDKALGSVLGVLRGVLLVALLAIAFSFVSSMTTNEKFIDVVESSKIVEMTNGIMTSVGGYNS